MKKHGNLLKIGDVKIDVYLFECVLLERSCAKIYAKAQQFSVNNRHHTYHACTLHNCMIISTNYKLQRIFRLYYSG